MRKIPWALIILISWMLLVSTGLYVYLFHLQPTKLGETVSAFLKEKTSLEFNIESIKFSFAPSPVVIASNAKFYDKSLQTSITVKKVEGVLSWRSLFMLKPVIKHLDVYNPFVHFVLPVREKKEIQHSVQDISKEAARKLFNYLQEFSIPHYFNSLKVTVHNGSGELVDPNADMAYFFENLNISAKAPDILDGYAQINLERLDILYENSPLFQLTGTKISAENVSYSPRTYSGNLKVESNVQAASLQRFYDTPINPAYNYFPMPEPSFVQLNTNFAIAIRNKEIRLDGTLVNKTVFPMNGHNTPVKLHIPFSMVSTFEKKNKSSLDFPYADNTLSPYKENFLKENTLSEYALDLPGFYVSEVRINNAEIRADADSLHFTGAATGLYPLNPLFFGKADVHNFSLPRWIGPTRNMSTGLYNALDGIKAEIEVFCTLKGVFSPKLKAKILDYEVQGKSVTANFLKPDICFDLELIAKGGGSLDLNPLFPEINGKNVRRVQLPPPAVAKSTSSEGGGTSVSHHINIHLPQNARIWKIDCSDINVLVAPDKSGTPTIAADIKNLYTGKASALAVLNSGKKHKITAKINSVLTEAPLRNIIGYTACTGYADANITLYLQGENVSEILNSLEIYGQASVKNGALHSKTKMLSKFSKLFADVSVKTIPFKTAVLPDTFALNGSWLFEGNFPEYAVKLSAKNSAVHFSTADGQPLFRNPQATNIMLTEKQSKTAVLNGIGKLGFNIGKNSLTLKEYKGMLRHSKLIANIEYIQKNKAHFKGNLYFQHFDLSDYIKNDAPQKHADKELPLDFICNNEVDLSLKADRLTFYDITTRNFTGNIKIKDNKISINNLKTNSQRGIVQALLEGSVTKHNQKYQMQTLFKLKAENIDMLSITKMRKQKTLMAGIGNIAIQGNANISKSSDIFKTMNADWSMNFFNGYFQSKKDHYSSSNNADFSVGQSANSAQYTGKTHYDTLSATGTVKNGVAETHNILLHGKGLDILAGGTVNLVTEVINAYARANYLGLSDIPIIITGTMENPQYEVKVLNAVSRSIGNIGAGIFDVFSNVITQPFKIFMQ